MELAVAPPPKIAAGVILEIPIVVTFSAATSPEDGKQENQDGKEPIVLGDLSGVWAFVSLTTPDMEQSLAPPRTDLLRGRTADSIHPINEEQDGERPTLAYATFSDIVISEPGQYRLKVNIIDMNRNKSARDYYAAEIDWGQLLDVDGRRIASPANFEPSRRAEV
ncbi:hypothetical protein H2202_006713 [Exophiala xenobiotica]|nr:hypothetical protein H2202_006713 [Exophiala xenobiotica]